MASGYVITGAWGNAVLLCGHHQGDAQEMVIEHSVHTLTYVCPKKHLANREEGEPCCQNSISVYDFEKALDHIAQLLVEAEANDEILFLRNHRWTYKTKSFEVIEHSGNKIVIKLTDRSV